MILLGLSTAAVLAGSFLFSLVLGLRRSVDVVTAWLVVFSAQICMIVLAVGLAGQLRPMPLAMVAVGVSVLQGLWMLTRRQVAGQCLGRLGNALAKALRRPWRHPVLLVVGLLVAIQYAWRLAIALRLPVLDWDGNYYHLISVDTWVQNEAVTHVPQVIFADTYPQNSELVTAWSATFLHDLSLAGVTQFLFVAMGMAAVVGLARNAGATAARSLLAGLLFAATPIVFLQVGTGYVDIAASATLLAAWQLLLSAFDFRAGRTARHRRLNYAVRSQFIRYYGVAGLAVGMMVGTKSSNLVAAAIAVAVGTGILATAWHQRRAPATPGPRETATVATEEAGRSALPDPGTAAFLGPAFQGKVLNLHLAELDVAAGGDTAVLTASSPEPTPDTPSMQTFKRYAVLPLCALVVPAVVVGGFWYIRNLVTYGNPVWPITIPFFPGQGAVNELLGSNAPPEITELSPLTQIGRSWVEDLYPHSFVYDQRLGGLGPQWILLLFPATVVMVFGFLRDRLIYLLGLLLPFVLLVMLRPDPWLSRYTIYLVGLGAVCYVLAVDGSGARWRRPLNVVLVVLVALGMWWATSPTYVRAGEPQHALTPAETLQLMRADYPTRMSAPYPWNGYGPVIDAPSGSVIAIPDQNILYFTHPYVGTRLERQLVIIPTPDDIDALYSSLVRNSADYVVLDPNGARTASLALAALKDHRFTQVGISFDGMIFTVG